MDLKETDILGDSAADHWYYRAKAEAMAGFVGDDHVSVILDVGAGSGFFSKYCLARSDAREAWCVDISYPADSDGSASGKPIHFRRAIDSVDADLVLLMDVLEHVDDDTGLLRACVDKVPAGARFLISVPAFPFLWSGHDVFLEHKRRYRLADIERVARRAGLQVSRGAYYFGAVFPLAVATRTASRLAGVRRDEPRSQLKRHGRLVNSVLYGLCRAELPWMRFNRLAGLTAFCLAVKV